MELLLERREALSIALEVITFAYYLAAIITFFPTLQNELATKQAVKGSVIDSLGAARQAFATNPSEAWEAVSKIRPPIHGAPPVPFPSLARPQDT